METSGDAAPAAIERKRMKIMLAIDDSTESSYALKWVLDYLCNITGTTPESSREGNMVTLVHVQQPFQHYYFTAGPGTAFYAAPSVLESVRQAQKENSAALLSGALQMCKDRMVEAETLILDGDPKDMICQVAEQMHIDLLVLGSRGLGKIKRAFLGSVSDYCAHHAVCPILIVKPPKDHSK